MRAEHCGSRWCLAVVRLAASVAFVSTGTVLADTTAGSCPTTRSRGAAEAPSALMQRDVGRITPPVPRPTSAAPLAEAVRAEGAELGPPDAEAEGPSLTLSSPAADAKIPPQAPAVRPDTQHPDCTPGSTCSLDGLPPVRGVCVLDKTSAPTGSRCFHSGTAKSDCNPVPVAECWDVCNTAHDPEDYASGGDAVPQAVRDVRNGMLEQVQCPMQEPLKLHPATGSDVADSGLTEMHVIKEATASARISNDAAEEASILAHHEALHAEELATKALSHEQVEPTAILKAAEVWEAAAAAHSNASVMASIAAKAKESLAYIIDNAHPMQQLASAKQPIMPRRPTPPDSSSHKTEAASEQLKQLQRFEEEQHRQLKRLHREEVENHSQQQLQKLQHEEELEHQQPHLLQHVEEPQQKLQHEEELEHQQPQLLEHVEEPQQKPQHEEELEHQQPQLLEHVEEPLHQQPQLLRKQQLQKLQHEEELQHQQPQLLQQRPLQKLQHGEVLQHRQPQLLQNQQLQKLQHEEELQHRQPQRQQQQQLLKLQHEEDRQPQLLQNQQQQNQQLQKLQHEEELQHRQPQRQQQPQLQQQQQQQLLKLQHEEDRQPQLLQNQQQRNQQLQKLQHEEELQHQQAHMQQLLREEQQEQRPSQVSLLQHRSKVITSSRQGSELAAPSNASATADEEAAPPQNKDRKRGYGMGYKKVTGMSAMRYWLYAFLNEWHEWHHQQNSDPRKP